MKTSFVIPAYNAVVWLPHAVKTALDQTHKDNEVVVVDDGSRDRTGEYLDWLEKNHPVKVVRSKKNIGRSAARNLGNLASQGDLILVLDADDLATPNRAELTASKFKRGTADYIYGAATVIDALGNPQMVIGADVLEKQRENECFENRIVHSTAAYTRDFAERFPYKGGDFSSLGIDDWEQQTNGLHSGARFDFITHRLACYRVFDGGQVTRSRDKEAVRKAKLAYLETLKVAA